MFSCEPRVVETLLYPESLTFILLEHILNQIYTTFGHTFCLQSSIVGFNLLYLFRQPLECIVIEGEVAHQHCVQDHTDAEYIEFEVVSRFFEDLGRHVCGSAEEPVGHPLDFSAQTQVNDLDTVILQSVLPVKANQDVF